MRTTLTIDDDVLAAAGEIARAEGKAVGTVISAWARRGLAPERRPSKRRNGLPLLPLRQPGVRVTSELVRQLNEELP